MEQKHIAALLESMCERPLTDSQAELSAELDAFCREAAKVLAQADDAQVCREADDIADSDRLTAALAALLSGADAEATRRTVEDAMLRSAAARLDAQSAIAFVAAIEQSPLSAPAHLVDEILAAGDAGAALSNASRPSANIWSLIASGSRSSRHWRIAAACAVLLVAGAASWAVYWPRTNPVLEGTPMPVPSGHPTVADVPAQGVPATAAARPCDPRGPTGQVTMAQRSEAPGGRRPAETAVGTDCGPAPGSRFADRPADEVEAAAARAASDAAGKVGAAPAGSGQIRANRSAPTFGAADHNPAAAARSAPAAAPPALPVVPSGAR